MRQKIPATETDFIQYLAAKFTLQSAEVKLGLGDDAAALSVKKDRALLLTVDTLVAGTHFLDIAADYENIGRKALLVNLSDLAAMAGLPRYFLLSLAIPQNFSFTKIDALLTGLAQEATANELVLLGGDCVRSPTLTITVTLLGEAPRHKYISRQGCSDGEGVFVTGFLGDAAAGLKYLKKKRDTLTKSRLALLDRHLLPPNRVKLSLYLARHFSPSAMLDLSDGLAAGLMELRRQNQVGFSIESERLPISDELRENFSPDQCVDFCLYGGEDYELLFTAPLESAAKLQQSASKKFGVPVSLIGVVKPLKSGIKINKGGRWVKLTGAGFEHFHFRRG